MAQCSPSYRKYNRHELVCGNPINVKTEQAMDTSWLYPTSLQISLPVRPLPLAPDCFLAESAVCKACEEL